MTDETNTETATVSANPALVAFPRDEWGFTANLRKYGLLVAGAIRGDEKKLALYIQTLGILAKHAQARLPVDQEDKARRLAEINATGLTRVSAQPVNTEE